MPEPPKQSFFKGFFGGGVKQLDRDELFGEGKGASSVAQVTQGDAIKGLTVGNNIIMTRHLSHVLCIFRQAVSAPKVRCLKQKCLQWREERS